jgi:TetR/AcrR family transcriptional regulator of autoinduction and epiphytic fitness
MCDIFASRRYRRSMARTAGAPADVDPRVERSRRVVCRAALDELAAAGYGAFTIESVAARAGVSRSTIYRHWPDKLALIADAYEILNQQPGPAAGADGESARARIERLLRHLAEVFQDSLVSACLPALVEGAEHDRRLGSFLHQYSDRRRQALVDAVAAGVASGEIAPTVDAELAGIALAGAIVYCRLLTAESFEPAAVGRLMTTVLGEPTAASRPTRPTTASRRERGDP